MPEVISLTAKQKLAIAFYKYSKATGYSLDYFKTCTEKIKSFSDEYAEKIYASGYLDSRLTHKDLAKQNYQALSVLFPTFRGVFFEDSHGMKQLEGFTVSYIPHDLTNQLQVRKLLEFSIDTAKLTQINPPKFFLLASPYHVGIKVVKWIDLFSSVVSFHCEDDGGFWVVSIEKFQQLVRRQDETLGDHTEHTEGEDQSCQNHKEQMET